MRKKNSGFALILTIACLTAIAITASYFATRIQQALQLATAHQNRIDQLIGISDTQAEILFRLSTTYISIYGLGVQSSHIALDNRPYEGEKFTEIRLQDTRGLINLNSATKEDLQRFLATIKIPAENIDPLIDKLQDYIDEDDLSRLNGAEKSSYLALGLAPPTNTQLRTPRDIQKILGWRDYEPFWRDNNIELVTTTNVAAVNPNTAPWQVLTVLPGVNEAVAKAIIQRREIEPIATQDIIMHMAGVSAEQLFLKMSPYPGSTIRVTQTAANLNWSIRYNVRLTPQSPTAPWLIEYFQKIDKAESQAQDSPPHQTVKLPIRNPNATSSFSPFSSGSTPNQPVNGGVDRH